MKIQGQDNQLMLAFPEGEVNCLTTEDAELCALLERADITIIGDHNRVRLRFAARIARRSC